MIEGAELCGVLKRKHSTLRSIVPLTMFHGTLCVIATANNNNNKSTNKVNFKRQMTWNHCRNRQSKKGTSQLNLSDQIKFWRAEHVTRVPNELHRTAGALQSTAGQRQRAAKKVRNQLLDHRVLGQPLYLSRSSAILTVSRTQKKSASRQNNQHHHHVLHYCIAALTSCLKQLVGKDNTLPKNQFAYHLLLVPIAYCL